MTKKFKCPYTFPLRQLEAMIDYIANIGGYSGRSYRESYPLSFNVKAYNINLDFDYLWKKYSTDSEFVPKYIRDDPVTFKAYQELAHECHKENEQHLWEWGQEEACRGVTDDDTYCSLWNGDTVATKFVFVGRSGGHIAIAEWGNFNFEGMSPEGLAETLRETDENGFCTSYATVRWLYKFCRQWEQDFTPDKASAAIEHHAAWALFNNEIAREWMEYEATLRERNAPKVRRIVIRRDQQEAI